MLGITTTRRTRRLLAEERARGDQLCAERDKALRDAETERQAKLSAARVAAEKHADTIHVSGRSRRLADLLAEGREEQAAGEDALKLAEEYVTHLERRVERLQQGCARYLTALWQERKAYLRMRRQAHEARRPYEARLAELTIANRGLDAQPWPDTEPDAEVRA